MFGEEPSCDLHKGIKSFSGFSNKNQVIREQEGWDVGVLEVYSKTWWVELGTKVIDE